MKRSQRIIIWVAVFICALGGIAAAIFLRPVADLDFLYTTYPEIKERIPASVTGTRIVYFLDPSFYYKFSASEADAIELARLLKLESVTSIDNSNRAFAKTGLFWHDWTWWHPNAANTSRLFNAYRDGNEIYLLYDFREQVIYIYIQNT